MEGLPIQHSVLPDSAVCSLYTAVQLCSMYCCTAVYGSIGVHTHAVYCQCDLYAINPGIYSLVIPDSRV